VLMKAFNTFVRPIVEYATVVWNPSAKMSIRRIEAVLKRFTKRLHGLRNLSYNARLEALNEYSLESRRVRADLTFCYKMLHGIVDIDFQKFLKPAQLSVTRGHQFKLCKLLCPSTFIASTFWHRVVNVWLGLQLCFNVVLLCCLICMSFFLGGGFM